MIITIDQEIQKVLIGWKDLNENEKKTFYYLISKKDYNNKNKFYKCNLSNDSKYLIFKLIISCDFYFEKWNINNLFDKDPENELVIFLKDKLLDEDLDSFVSYIYFKAINLSNNFLLKLMEINRKKISEKCQDILINRSYNLYALENIVKKIKPEVRNYCKIALKLKHLKSTFKEDLSVFINKYPEVEKYMRIS